MTDKQNTDGRFSHNFWLRLAFYASSATLGFYCDGNKPGMAIGIVCVMVLVPIWAAVHDTRQP